MWRVTAKSADGTVVWKADPFDTEQEAQAYADKAVEKRWNVTTWGEELSLWVERM